MIKTIFPTEKFTRLTTPFYYYDLELLRATLQEIHSLELPESYQVHYALKANVNPEILQVIRKSGLGADCVSGGEIRAAVEAGFPASKIVFAGVGKADWEIQLALEKNIGRFNVESIPELEVINELAGEMEKTAVVAIRINPNVDAETHKYITTGLDENKFGVGLNDIDTVIAMLPGLKNIQFDGIHLHIGSQITEMEPYKKLCERIDEIRTIFSQAGVEIKSINAGGGLGIDYENPDDYPIPAFEPFFRVFRENLKLEPGQTLHFELGRSLVAQCGTLISKVLYVKESGERKFAILDAGMTDLIRPALYEAYHLIENLTSGEEELEQYDVVGPICESSDSFAERFAMKRTKRGDLLAIRSAGAYGEIMASRYNLRDLPGAVTSDELSKQ